MLVGITLILGALVSTVSADAAVGLQSFIPQELTCTDIRNGVKASTFPDEDLNQGYVELEQGSGQWSEVTLWSFADHTDVDPPYVQLGGEMFALIDEMKVAVWAKDIENDMEQDMACEFQIGLKRTFTESGESAIYQWTSPWPYTSFDCLNVAESTFKLSDITTDDFPDSFQLELVAKLINQPVGQKCGFYFNIDFMGIDPPAENV